MCPMCISTALMIAGSVASTGGLAAAAFRKSGTNDAADDRSAATQSDENRTASIVNSLLRIRRDR